MKKILIVFGILFLAVISLIAIAGGYSFFKAGKLKPSVEKFIDGFYISVNSQNYRHIYDVMASQEFRGSTGYESFEGFMKGVHRALGGVKKRTENGWKILTLTGGTYFEINYKTGRERGSASETFSLKKDNGSWSMSGYNVSSPDLVQQ